MKRKELGQHFLIDSTVIQDEIQSANLINSDIVLEVGPGKGALTFPIAEKVKKMYAIEKDRFLYKNLLDIAPQNVEVINADILNVDFSLLNDITKIVSNLPYKISSPLTFKLFSLSFEKAILLYQKEFAERICAQPNTDQYSRLSVGVYYHAKSKIIRHVSPLSFDPPPKISSSIIELIPRSKPAFNVINEDFFFSLTKSLFNYRRKKIKTIIRNVYGIEMKTNNLFDCRVGQLTPEQIGLISDMVYLNLYNSD